MELAPRRYLRTSFSFEAAYQAMDAWLKEGQKPQAVFAMSDTTAIGAIRALRDHGLRVPEDVSVIGFDGVELANFYTPRLCTMRGSPPIALPRPAWSCCGAASRKISPPAPGCWRRSWCSVNRWPSADKFVFRREWPALQLSTI